MTAMTSWAPAVTPGRGGPVPTSRQVPLRLTRRGRTVVALAAFALAAAGVVATGSAQAGTAGHGVEVTRHVVERGDTLWALAGTVAAPREDLRDVVREIERLNALDGADLRAGDVLLLPVARD